MPFMNCLRSRTSSSRPAILRRYIFGVKGGSIHSRFQLGGILYQIAWNQVDLEAVHLGMNIRMLRIFLLMIGGDKPCHLQGRPKISLRGTPKNMSRS